MTARDQTSTSARSHSYQGQDLFVLDVLRGLRAGFFLDSGASNGVKGSNTKLLESSFGWTGICVEPNAALFAELVSNRTCTCLNCCLYDREGQVEFFEAAGVYGGILQEYEPQHLRFARGRVSEVDPPTALPVPQDAPPTRHKRARTVRSVLREHGAPRVIDYWSLDTEGSELAILRSFPFHDYAFRVLTVEHNYSPSRTAIHSLLQGRGYTRVRSLGIDDCYVWSDDSTTGSWRSGAWTRVRVGAA